MTTRKVTNPRKTKRTSLWTLTPLFGSVLYLLLYFSATLYYPGGSQFDKNTKGYHWLQNYWCNLLNEYAINGQPNPATPIALTAMTILCIALGVFWYLFPLQVGFKKRARLLIQVSGISAMVIGWFLFTSFHDLIINIATSLAVIALSGTFVGLRKLNWRKLLWMGLFTLVLIGLNCLLYYGNVLQLYLPAVQIITFLYFLVWICSVNIGLYNITATEKK